MCIRDRATCTWATISAAGRLRTSAWVPVWQRVTVAFSERRVSRVNGRIVGDIAPEVAQVAGFLAPNPGGVGPMTRAMLLSNVVDAAEARAAE